MSLSAFQSNPSATLRTAALGLVYAAVLFVSLLASFFLRFDFVVPAEFWGRFWNSAVWIVPLKLALLAFFGQFRSLLTFFGLPDVKRLALVVLLAALIVAAVWLLRGGADVVPRGVIAIDALFSFLGLLGLRMSMRLYREQLFSTDHGTSGVKHKKVIIVGAGSTGADLCRELLSKPGIGLQVEAFIDNDQRKIGNTLHGKPILGPLSRLGEFAAEIGARKILIAMPGAGPVAIKDLVKLANDAGLEHDILPSMSQLLDREVTINHLRHVEPEDLLRRAPANLDVDGIAELIRGQVVMVTGAGGSIGGELCRQLADQDPRRLVLVERSEPALFSIAQELGWSHRHVDIVAAASDVCDAERMESLFAEHRPTIVFHAAAHKHVGLMEAQPAEAVRNNVSGTVVLARLAQRHNVARFVLVSTDKAVNPTSVMGATKRLAEMIVEFFHRSPGNTCIWCAVRFGNVLGSSGSVVPIFRRQIDQGGPVTLTHPDATRYFMSIGESVGLILQSARQAHGGEVFVLDMGEPVKIADLANQMIEMSGFQPGKDIKIETIGLRPGEKLYEEPIHEMENVEATEHPQVLRLRANGRYQTLDLTEEFFFLDRNILAHADRVKAWLHAKVPEYRNGAN